MQAQFIQILENDEIEQKRQEYLSEIYRMAVIAFGQPVQKFDLEFKDDDGNYKLDQNITPLDFFHNYFEDDLDELENYISDEEEYNLYTISRNVGDNK